MSLLEYLPEFIQEIKEMKVIMSVEDEFLTGEGDNLKLATKNVFKDQFINTATPNGVKRYEEMLGIVSKATESLDVRQFRLFVRFNETLPYTVPKLKEQLAKLCGYDGYSIWVDVVNYELIVKLALKSKGMFNEVGQMLERTVPLNMVIDLDLMYNQHLTLNQFTHSYLAKYTQKQLRDEVLS